MSNLRMPNKRVSTRSQLAATSRDMGLGIYLSRHRVMEHGQSKFDRIKEQLLNRPKAATGK